MMSKIICTFNSHRTFMGDLTNDFMDSLEKNNRFLEYRSQEFIHYSNEKLGYQVTIDSRLSVYITFKNSKRTLPYIISAAKEEYLFLCTLDSNFDKNSKIKISLPLDFKTPSSPIYDTVPLKDGLLLTV